MRIKQLKMQSFRGIGDLTLDFDEKEPTVLVGINGVGKSSILDCIAILLSHLITMIAYSDTPFAGFTVSLLDSVTYEDKDENSFVRYPDIKFKNFDFGLEIKNGYRIKRRFFEEEDITNKHQEINSNIVVLLESNEATWSLKKNREKNITHYTNKSINEEKYKELNETTLDIYNQWKANLKDNNCPLAVYYPVNRGVFGIDLQVKETHSFEIIDAYDQALNGVQISFHRFFQWFRYLEDLENEERRDNPEYRNPQLESVRQAIYSLIPDFSKLRVHRSPTLRMTVQKNGEELIINQLSDGEKCLLAMVGDLARRLAIANPGLEDPLQGFGVVLIDEIELHLHPKWQREIIPALTRTFPNCQFIVTTHSPQVISEVKPEGIYVLKKTDNGVIAVRPESSYGRDSNQILEDLMGVPKRPQEFQDSLHHLFQLIEEGNLDGARQLSQQIADIMGESEPELVKARVSIKRKEILKR